MDNNLGRLVKWLGDDGGWHTGREVLHPDNSRVVSSEIVDPHPKPRTWKVLVRESCDGKLTWVDLSKLQPWQPRSEWEDDPANMMASAHDYC